MCHSGIKKIIKIIQVKVNIAKDKNIAAIALTDVSNLFAAVKFYKQALKSGTKPIFGVELKIDTDFGVCDLVLLAENNDGYQLGSRKSISSPKPIYDCNGEGVVVVRIWVDKSGIVQNAKGEVSGSTTSLSCLVRRAEEAAFKTRFEGDPMATDLQVGSIRYNFYHL